MQVPLGDGEDLETRDRRHEPKVSTARVLLMIWLIAAVGYISLIPVSNNVVLYSLLVSLGVIAGISFLTGGARLSAMLLVPAGAWVAFVVYGTAVAVINSAESWQRTLVFLLLWPVFYFVVIVGFRRAAVSVIFYVGAIVTIVISAIFLLGGLAAVGRAPFESLPMWITAPIGFRFVVDAAGTIALTSHSLPPLMWWGAMWVASLAYGTRSIYLPPTWVRLLAASLAVAASIVAWRRAIVLVLVLVPLLMLVTWLSLRIRNSHGLSVSSHSLRGALIRVVASYVIAGALAAGVQTGVLPLLTQALRSAGIVASLEAGNAPPSRGLPGPTTASSAAPNSDGEDPIDDPAPAKPAPPLVTTNDRLADSIRQNESSSLLDHKTPLDVLFGHGIGASFDRGGYDRPGMKPWQTELQYHGLYNWTGVMGLVLLAITFVTSVRLMRHAFRIDDSLRVILFVSCVGAVATLLGNATNPYLQAPGHMWPVFLPFMIASVILGARNHRQVSLTKAWMAARRRIVGKK